ncbi:hypothetical protein OQA88_8048 [Cercophora sp. LCS_1]
MSGFEIAGVVLGSIPLLISALEHYGEGLSTIQRWRKYQRELQSLVRNLKTEQVKLQNVCEKLLVGLVPHSKIEDLIDDPLGDLWRQEDVERKIRARLWKSHSVFEETITEIKSAIDKMMAKIDAQNGGNVSELRRGIFTLRRSSYEELLSSIRNGVSQLENLTDRNIELEPERRVRSQTKLFWVLRDMANSFYRALRSSFGCSCSHDVGLELARRSADITPMDDNERIMKDLAFQLAISYKSIACGDGADSQAMVTWQEILVKAVWTPTPAPAIPSPTSAGQPPGPTTRISATTSGSLIAVKAKTKKSVTFGFSHSKTSSSVSSCTTLVETSTELHTLIPNLKIGVTSQTDVSGIDAALDLCGKLHKTEKQAAVDTYGTIADTVPQARRKYSIHPTPEPSGAWRVVSLRQILDHKDQFPPLSYRDRLRLAVTISSSVLQLYSTPWLPPILTSQDIFFIQKAPEQQSYFPNPAMYWHPVVLKQLPDKEVKPPVDKSAGITERNPSLLSLGCVLIEVILGKTLDSKRSTPPSAGTNLLSDYVTAQSLMDEVRMKSSNYETAVARCFDGKLHRQKCGLEDGDLCQEVYSGVVALLEKDLENS